ncbi:MAG: hypothetical protein IT457_22740 [Planctomycetes bacterium]|nr:hypothetical protein [Planctomycetota bacterium]
MNPLRRTLLAPALAASALLLVQIPQDPPSAPSGIKAGGKAGVEAAATAPSAMEDGASLATLMNALYAAVSGAAGQPRDFARLERIGHRLGRIVTFVPAKDGPRVVAQPITEFVRRSAAAPIAEGFLETPVVERIEEWGDMAQIWSSYAVRHAAEDAEPFARGINVVTAVREGGRWQVLQVLFRGEGEGLELPAQYRTPDPERGREDARR